MHSPLASVDGVRNGVLIESDAAGETLCTGPGAGAGPTGSAVVSDLIDLVREGANGTSSGRRVSRVETLSVLKAEDSRSAFYLRMTVTDESGVIAALTAILAARSVSLDKIFQQNLTDNRSMVVLITDQIRQGELDAAIEELLAHKAVVSDIQKLRVY
jgi:homoserine dehydrogenase